MSSLGSVQYSKEYLRQEKDLPVDVQIVVRSLVLEVLAKKGMSLASSLWLKPLGNGLWEFRIGRNLKSVLKSAGVKISSRSANRRILIGVFFAFEEDCILLLGCYNKLRFGGERAQNLAINKARELLLTFRRER
jgi:hypothetical protein